MWSLTVLHRHALYGDCQVTEGCWVEWESQVPVGGVDRVREFEPNMHKLNQLHIQHHKGEPNIPPDMRKN